jgi:hypothetical protein
VETARGMDHDDNQAFKSKDTEPYTFSVFAYSTMITKENALGNNPETRINVAKSPHIPEIEAFKSPEIDICTTKVRLSSICTSINNGGNLI